jgi:hypothetical protein
MDRNVFSKTAFGCLLALALPGSALAATPPTFDGPASVGEAAGKATYKVNCGTVANAPLPDVPYTGPMTITVAPGPAPVATKDADYQDPDPLTTTIPCTAIVTSGNVDVPILEDTLDEPGEKFTLTATRDLAGDSAAFTATITDNDVPEATISPFVAVLEGENPNAVMTVTLSQVPVEPATVSYATQAFSALAGSDFTAASGEVTIPAGQQTGTISVPILDDAAPEKPEAFYVNLSSPVNATLNDTKKQGVVAIFDKDEAPLPAFSLPRGVAVQEGNAGTVNVLFPITLSTAPTETIKVDWRTASFSATLTDYESANGTVSFAPGETTKTVSVNVKGDIRDEPNEAFALILGNPVGGTIAAGRSFGVITDDDGPKVGIGRPVVRGKSLIMVLTCPKTADLCKGSLKATLGKIRAGSAKFELAKGTGREVKVRLSRKARRALAKRARRMKFTATAADASGAQRTVTRRYRIPRRR